jgi:hypothetical protein
MTKTLVMDGCGCDRGLHVVFPHSDSSAAMYRSPLVAFGDTPVAPGSSPSSPMLICFSSIDQKPTQQVVTIVNNKGSSNGDYSVEGLLDSDIKNGWKMEPLKANVAPGTKASVTVTFAPTQLLMDSLPIPKVSVVSLCNVRIVLKGGTPSTDTTMFVQLKGTACR